MPSLAQMVRAKYPGAYDDIPDAQLEAQVLAKHPEYQDLATPPQQAQPEAQLRSRTGQMYTPPKESGASEFFGAPGRLLSGLASLPGQLYNDPAGALKNIAMAPVRTLGGLVTNPASTLGDLTLAAAAPQIPGAAKAGASAAMDIPGAAPLAGAALGYGLHGWPGAIEGAMGGGIVGRVGGYLRSGTQANEAAAAASEAQRAATVAAAERAAAKANPSIFVEPSPGLSQMLGRDATGQAVQQAEETALRNQLQHALRSR
jgi:hypothetical protein